MKGGAERIIPLYQEPKNSPFIPNIQKEIYNQKNFEKGIFPNQAQAQGQGQSQGQGQKPGLTPLVNLQVYQPPKPKPEQKGPTLFAPPFAPTPFYPPQYYYQLPPYMLQQQGMAQQYQIPVVNTYNINIDGVTGDHNKLGLIYEDMIPSQYNRQFMGTVTTLGERVAIYNYMRAMMFPHGDGKDIGLDGKSSNSLLSHLKFMDLNPYNTYKLSPNPYKGLPMDYLIYRSCYPIRHDPVGSTVVCAKNSIGMNIRIYKLTQGSYTMNTLKEKSMKDYEEWREISYYEYVREQILKKKQTPTFAMMYGYDISEQCKIDFDKIALMKQIQREQQPTYISNQVTTSVAPMQSVPTNQTGGFVKGNKTNGTLKSNLTGGVVNIDPSLCAQPMPPRQVAPIATVMVQPVRQSRELTPNPNAFVGKAIVSMSESPTYNIYNWASKTYQSDGNKRIQINTGFHLDKVWFSVLFQIIVATYAMQIHKICFNDFTPEDNIYIKDLNIGGAATQYWKYKIDGIDYYIPNYGYLVWIDSNFKDLPISASSVLDCITNVTGSNFNLLNTNKNIGPHKIYAEFLGDNIIFKSICFDQFIKSIDTNMFSQEFINNGGCVPPPEVCFLMDSIKNEALTDNEKDIGKYLYKYMKQFMNNRIGTYLKETEITNIRKDEQKDFLKGSIVVYEDGASSYKFVSFIGLEAGGNGVANILTKNDPTNPDIIEIQVPVTSLYAYTKTEAVVQTYKPNESILNEEELLETYVLNKN